MNFRRAILATVVVVVGTSVLLAKDPPGVTVNKGTQSLGKVLGEPRFTVLNINDFLMWTRSDGYNNHTPADNSGGFYPRGTAGSIYLDSFVWGAKAYVDSAFTTEAADQVIRLGGGTYNIATRAGRILGTGASAVPEATDLANVRTYRVRRDYASMTQDELKRDASEILRIPIESVTDAQAADVYNQYDTDWKDWPVASGAPFIDRNNNSVFDATPAFSATFTVDSLVSQGKDEPGVAGADLNLPAGQVIWTVYNDLSPSLVNGFSGSLPMGIEIQKTTWGYKASGEIGSLYFQRIKMINKGGVVVNPTTGALGTLHYDSVFVCQWSDPDLGDFGDDIVGCDTVLNIGYVYNGQGRDVEYQKFGLKPPSVGYDFLAGPVIDGGDSAVVDLNLNLIHNTE
ncbi:MAG: hypothetical protein HY563_01280, partial [Ignavibacteriales bacterium]|nr:hypothetical protein [Ignavibacteriales bacterium]